MWSTLYNYFKDKLFTEPTVGQKRKLKHLYNRCLNVRLKQYHLIGSIYYLFGRNEEWTGYPPMKQMKLDTRSKLDIENLSYEFVNIMKKQENYYKDEDECITNEIFPTKWGSSSSMARQSIHRSTYSLDSSVPLDKRKIGSNSRSQILKQSDLCQPSSMEEIEVKYVNKNTAQRSGKVLKNKTSSRIFPSYQFPNVRQNADKSREGTFQSNMKKSLNFLRESYRLSEKVQYMQLLQQQTTKLNSLLTPFTIQRIGSQKGSKSSIPLIDLTKEKNVVIDRSRENIPWTSSWAKLNDSASCSDSNSGKKNLPKINTLQDILKTHPVTEKHAIDEILSRHSTETAEKRRQAEIEKAKLEILNVSNRKAYSDALEEKMRNYMRITTPALEEFEPEKDKYVLPELTKEQQSKITSVLMPSPSGEVIVEKFGLQIKRRDLQTLKGLNWLNDEVINFYMNLIMERGNQDNLPNVYAFNTFFYPKLISGGHSSLKRWTKKVDIFSYDMILVPIHLGMHWCMAVIDFRSKEVRYYDSMGSSNSRCLQALLSYLEAESLDKKKTAYCTKDWEQINVDDIPQQMNGSDCGVFSCMFAEHLARNSPLLFSQDQMPYFRRKMALEIVESKLLT